MRIVDEEEKITLQQDTTRKHLSSINDLLL